MANIPKCEAVLDHITMNPESHDQTKWAVRTECGTAGCFAGWAVMLDGGWELDWFDGNFVGQHTSFAKRTGHWAGDLIHEAAREILELTPQEANVLFYAGNTIDDLGRMVKNLANGDSIA
jgi:hypothetical protein